MGKIVMPKNSALLNEIESVLQIYYEADNWLPNDEYKAKLKSMIGDDQYSSSYTKKAQITSYFGFTVWEDINNPQSRRRITPSGKKMYEAIKAENTAEVQEVLMNALETVKFGRDNYGCPESSSDVEPPSLYVRAILDMGYLTYREFAFLLWKLENLGANYTDALSELKALRSRGTIELDEEAKKYADCKPIMILVRWGFLAEDTTDASGGKHIIIAPEVLSKHETRLRNLKIYNIDMDCDAPITDDYFTFEADEKNNNKCLLENFDFSTSNITDGENLIVYGTPGCGKSYYVEHTLLKDYPTENYIRTTFFQDYTNTDFVGQILPVVDGERVTYKFNPGPFTLALKRAIEKPNEKVALVIEELNRGSAASIFGDIFQLLDRKNGVSEYSINNVNIINYLKEKFEGKYTFDSIKLPGNLSIYATMNTSDQNVFTLDTAFKRRWKFKKLLNKFESDHQFKDKYIPGANITWKNFVDGINKYILESSSGLNSEDKQLGVYFVDNNGMRDITTDISEPQAIEDFAYKVLEYLWADVAKFDRPGWFDKEIKSLDDLVAEYKKRGIEVFADEVFNK